MITPPPLARPAGGRRLPGRSHAVALAAALLTACSRLPGLGRPDVFVFDEIYYAEQAREITIWGVERGHTVHPPLGKWLLAVGIRLFGFTPFGWRIVPLLAGAVVVGLTVLAARRLTGSDGLAVLAGTIVATDGIAVVDGRLALLDGLLAVFTTGALTVLLVSVARPLDLPLLRRASVGCGLLLGAALAVKWSAAPLLVVSAAVFLGLVRRIWPAGARRRAEVARLVVALGLVPLAVYTLCYVPTILAYGHSGVRREVCAERESCDDSLLARVEGIAADHWRVARFHGSLRPTNRFAASAATWVIQAHPAGLLLSECAADPDDARDPVCGPGERGVRRIVAVGNPLIWVAGTLALLGCGLLAARRREALLAIPSIWAAAMWVPWVVGGRDGYSFYAVVVVPPLALAICAVIGRLDGRRRQIAAVGCAAICLVGAALLAPSWTGALTDESTLFGWIDRLTR